MSLEQYESSVEQGRPIYLYAFALGARVWRYTSSASDVVTVDGFVWAACAISHDGVKQTGEAASDALSIEAPISVAPAQLYLSHPPTSQITVRILQKDASDPELYAIYAGEVSQVNVPEPGRVSITCETLSVSLRREGLRFGWQRSCPYALYDPLTCKLDKAAHAVATTVATISGNAITVNSAITLAIYGGGFLQWTHPVKGIEYLGIESQVGSTLNIFGSTAELHTGIEVTLYRGCNRTPAVCRSFGNYDNYGGIPNMPGKSPFDGTNPFY